MFYVPGYLLLVLGPRIPDAQLTGQPFHAFFRLEQVAKNVLQIVLQRPRGSRCRGRVVGRFRGFSGWHHHHHLRFGRVETDKLLPLLPQRLQEQCGGHKNGQRQDDYGQRYDEQLQHQCFYGKQNGYLGQEQRCDGRHHGLNKPELSRTSCLQQVGQYVVGEWGRTGHRCGWNR